VSGDREKFIAIKWLHWIYYKTTLPVVTAETLLWQCCPPPPNAATPRDFHTPPQPVIFRGVKRREIGNFIAIADE